MSQGSMISAYVAHDIFYNKGEEYATFCACKVAKQCVFLEKTMRYIAAMTAHRLLCSIVENGKSEIKTWAIPALKNM